MMTEVEEEGLSSSEDPTTAARSEGTEQRAADNKEQTPETETRAPEPDKRSAETQESVPEPDKRTTPETQERPPKTEERAPEPDKQAAEPEKRAPESQERAWVPPRPMQAGPPLVLEVPAPVDPSLLQYKLKKFFVLRVKHFHFPFIITGNHCHAKP